MYDELIAFTKDLRDSELLAATQVLASYEALDSRERAQLLGHMTQEFERRAEQPRPTPLPGTGATL